MGPIERFCLVSLCLACLWPHTAVAQKHELGFGLGAFFSGERKTVREPLAIGHGLGLQVNYGLRLIDGENVDVLLDMNLLANPVRRVDSGPPEASRDFASLYLTPGFRLKFRPRRYLSPWMAFNAGYALYEHSELTRGGDPNPAPRHLSRGALVFGAGLDAEVTRDISFRGEVRDYYSGSPVYNIPSPGGQHNLMASGSFVFRWGD
ncbi:MAG: hypothetical protein IPM24_14415 [Bryobacterales bacterium]|nr:hypothetical protein [Bryobacterales bacterium]